MLERHAACNRKMRMTEKEDVQSISGAEILLERDAIMPLDKSVDQ